MFIERKFITEYLFRPHSPVLVIALAAVIFEGVADLLEPRPIKVVLDYVIGSKSMPEWLAGFIGAMFGEDKIAVFDLAVIIVVAVAIVGAIILHEE